MSQFGRGLKKAHVSRSAHRLRAALHPEIAKVLATGLPSSGSLEPASPMDQGRSSTCFAHAASGAAWTTLAAKGKALAWLPSPLVIASCTYADVRASLIPAGQTLPELQDTGAELPDAATALARWGIAPMGALVGGRGGPSDVPDDPADGSFPEPDQHQVELAGQDLIAGEYSIDVDQDAPGVVAASIVAGIAVWDGGPVNDLYESISGSSLATASCATGEDGHSQYVAKFRTGAAGLEFLYCNSWGTGWGAAGGIWVDTSFLLTRWTLWPMAVAS